MRTPIAISDSANFYVSVERLFEPSLKNTPVIVLSNNDGCAVARSDEAKALGIKMGSPFHKLKDVISKHGVRVFSSNYTLYGDISRRVVDVYQEFSPTVEVYSIDECFMDLGGFKDREAHAQKMRQAVLRRVGIPVRVGIAPTKTLAKCANDIAKKNALFDGVLDMMDGQLIDWLLPKVPVADIWGIGRKSNNKLNALGIYTAADLQRMPLKQARSVGTVVLEKTVLELQGEPCLALDEVEPQRKGMAVTRSSGTPMFEFDILFEAITAHATRAAEKLRQNGLVAGTLTVFFHTNRHKPDRPQYAASRSIQLSPMSCDTFELVRAARQCARAAWPKANSCQYGFTKAGVMLDDLLPIEKRPLTLFDVADKKPNPAVEAVDHINRRFGKKAITLGSEGVQRSWKMRSAHCSPRYTTRISDLPVVR
jgi:DNA polymerase V